ncbi:MAG TPA: hypothetical protein VFO07_14420 [Roseiflexaceae bacterium]|nr:hypothetical protein [Roseiflexaceae bacterium]
MTSWIDEAFKEEQRQDLLRDAARRRLIAQAHAAKQPSKRLYSPVMVRLGRWLEICGRSLQTRYGVLAEAGVIRAASDGTSRY